MIKTKKVHVFMVHNLLVRQSKKKVLYFLWPERIVF